MLKALKALLVIGLLGATLSIGGCGYAGVATAGDAVVIARNDWILFGLLRKVYVCKITPQGVTQCANAEEP